MALTYIRTDKNGTKIYHNYTCPRCGGVGGNDAWAYTGWTCYSCGGTGRREKAEVIKEYTPEYRAKLDAQREKREEKKRNEIMAKAVELNEEFFDRQGISREGFFWVVLGNTYEIKDELREAGATYNSDLGWYFNKQTSYPSIMLHVDEYYRKDQYGVYRWNEVNYGEVVDATKAKIKEANNSEKNITSQHFGNVGDKLDITAKYTRSSSWETHFGYRTQTQYCHTFTDGEGHIFIWKTTSPIYDIDIDTEVELKGTIKAHDEYKGIKQTSLQRCKITA